jgi:hypothetical protein
VAEAWSNLAARRLRKSKATEVPCVGQPDVSGVVVASAGSLPDPAAGLRPTSLFAGPWPCVGRRSRSCCGWPRRVHADRHAGAGCWRRSPASAAECFAAARTGLLDGPCAPPWASLRRLLPGDVGSSRPCSVAGGRRHDEPAGSARSDLRCIVQLLLFTVGAWSPRASMHAGRVRKLCWPTSGVPG